MRRTASAALLLAACARAPANAPATAPANAPASVPADAPPAPAPAPAPAAHASDAAEPEDVEARGAPRLLALCASEPVDVYDDQPFRGVAPEDGGTTACCPLAGDAFVCERTRGHQHEALVVTETLFVAGPKGPRVTLTSGVARNRGMRSPAEPIAALVVRRGAEGAVHLDVAPEGACDAHPRDAAAVCAHRGTYALAGGVLRRLR